MFSNPGHLRPSDSWHPNYYGVGNEILERVRLAILLSLNGKLLERLVCYGTGFCPLAKPFLVTSRAGTQELVGFPAASPSGGLVWPSNVPPAGILAMS